MKFAEARFKGKKNIVGKWRKRERERERERERKKEKRRRQRAGCKSQIGLFLKLSLKKFH
jgi:hypothetical protein